MDSSQDQTPWTPPTARPRKRSSSFRTATGRPSSRQDKEIPSNITQESSSVDSSNHIVMDDSQTDRVSSGDFGSDSSVGDGRGSSFRDSTSSISSMRPPSSTATSFVREQIPAVHLQYTDLLRQFLGDDMVDLEQHHLECYQTADERPPINQDSLEELNIARIINNPKLRHDINFDRDLHFRPNTEGPKGKQKSQQAEDFYTALEVELRLYRTLQRHDGNAHNQPSEIFHTYLSSWSAMSPTFPPPLNFHRLPNVLHAIRDILKTLVPTNDQDLINDRLDVDLIMQQIRVGVCDLIDLAMWLSKMLKSHCAPMRDKLVDRMYHEIVAGAMENDLSKFVDGLRQLMKILEAMKLDVANHQIRHIRRLLIDGTITYQQKYNAHRIENGKMNPYASKRWLQEAVEEMFQMDGYCHASIDALVWALVRDLTEDSPAQYGPASFYLDADRLKTFGTELQAEIYQAVCKDILIQMVGNRASSHDLAQASDVLHDRIAILVGKHGNFINEMDRIAVEIVRVLLMVEGQNSTINADLLYMVERKLGEEMHATSRTYNEAARRVRQRLVPKIQARVQECLPMSALDLQDRFLPPVPTKTSSTPMGYGAILEPSAELCGGSHRIDPDDDFVNRFTHMIVLHWQVWADLVYLTPEVESNGDGPGSGSAAHPDHARGTTSTRPGPRTRPVAQAEYAPGHKFLPISVTMIDVPEYTGDAPAPQPS